MIRHQFVEAAAAGLALVLMSLLSVIPASGAEELAGRRLLGKMLLVDKNLAVPSAPGQACVACHGAGVGYTGRDSAINATTGVYQGAKGGRFGNRKPPALAYAGRSPILHYDSLSGGWIGGMFWDGRATGATLGDPLAEQAQGPFLNPLEQNNPSAASVVDKVLGSSYRSLFIQVCESACTGPGCASYDAQAAYECIARSIAAYERSPEVNPFSSRYDRYLAGTATLSDMKMLGLSLFEGKAGCDRCHPSRPGPGGERPVFTGFSYDNTGVPRNPLNPFYYEPEWNPLGQNWTDEGLGGFLRSTGVALSVYEPELGKMKVPTLRNVNRRPYPNFVKAYGHNGYFKSLAEIVHFYNTRDLLPECAAGSPGEKVTCWPPAELDLNVNHADLGNLGLTDVEEAAIVAFLKALTDEQ